VLDINHRGAAFFFPFRFSSRTATAAAGRSAHCNSIRYLYRCRWKKKKTKSNEKNRPDLGYCSWTVARTTGGEKTIKTISSIIAFSAGVILSGSAAVGYVPEILSTNGIRCLYEKKKIVIKNEKYLELLGSVV